jgi:hypothetical protein
MLLAAFPAAAKSGFYRGDWCAYTDHRAQLENHESRVPAMNFVYISSGVAVSGILAGGRENQMADLELPTGFAGRSDCRASVIMWVIISMGWRWHFVEVAFGGSRAEVVVWRSGGNLCGGSDVVPEAAKDLQIACCRVT